MTSRLLHALFSLSFVLCFLQPGLGRGDESLRGPLPEEQRSLIQYLAEHHNELRREVTLLDDGYAASTTTVNKELAEKLKQHVAYMKKRLGSGAMVRRWDPAFVELVEFHDQITAEISDLENGIRVVVVGKTPDAIKVAQNHARIVTGFVTNGPDAVHERHEPVTGGKGKSDPGSDAGDEQY